MQTVFHPQPALTNIQVTLIRASVQKYIRWLREQCFAPGSGSLLMCFTTVFLCLTLSHPWAFLCVAIPVTFLIKAF